MQLATPPATTGEAEDAPAAGSLAVLADGLTILLAVGALFVVGWLLWKFLHGWREIAGSSEAEESRFEAELLSSAYLSDGPAVPPSAPPPGTEEAGNPESPVAETPTAAPAGSGPGAAGAGEADGLEAFRQRLEQLRVLGPVEGKVALALPPEGLVCRLTRGGSCLVLPRLESAEAMDHFLRRFGTVIYPGRGGDPVVVERVSDRLKDLSGL